ncbi:MAG: hypothetical protein LBL83_06830 [Clostridiales bacterium]|jgi:hypothetical protein|nr:hypothetical protein [Clostridiales bacterium]
MSGAFRAYVGRMSGNRQKFENKTLSECIFPGDLEAQIACHPHYREYSLPADAIAQPLCSHCAVSAAKIWHRQMRAIWLLLYQSQNLKRDGRKDEQAKHRQGLAF